MADASRAITVRYHGLQRDEEEVVLGGETSYEALLRERGIHPETVLVFEDGQVVPHETAAKPGATIRVVRILSGG